MGVGVCFVLGFLVLDILTIAGRKEERERERD
jgi:hypothetical protein